MKMYNVYNMKMCKKRQAFNCVPGCRAAQLTKPAELLCRHGPNQAAQDPPGRYLGNIWYII